jgi:regulator of sigma E protease
MQHVLFIIESILAVNFLILVHELGHMAAGRIFGIPSSRLSIGLGRRLAGFRFRGTDYYVAPVPLGGFVELQHGHRHDNRTACMDCVSPWKRMVVFIAGPAANLLFVVALFWLAYCAVGFRDRKPIVAEVSPGSLASQAGIEPKDKILRVNGTPVVSWAQLLVASDRSQGKDLAMVLQREAGSGVREKSDIQGGPGMQGGVPEAGSKARSGFVFVSLSLPAEAVRGLVPSEDQVRLRLGPVAAIQMSMEKFWTLSKLLWHSVTGLVTARVSPSELVGPVYLFHISAQAAQESQAYLLYLLAIISASLCFFNLLPLPILDGGQVALTLVQKFLRRPLQPRSMRLLSRASFVWLLLILLSATLNDVVRLLAS